MSIARDTYIGEPQYPAPWTAKKPREGLRDTDEARIVSLSPDVCWTPVGSAVVPIPYPVVDFCGHDKNYAPSVRFTGKKTMVMRSCTMHVHGDAPGILTGLKSGTVESICEPIGHAEQVRAEGSNVIRHLDRFYMNSRNTQGEAIFVRSTQTYDPPIDDDPVPGSLKWIDSAGNEVMSDASPEPVIAGALYAQASPSHQPVPRSPSQPTVPRQTPRAPVGGSNVIQGPWTPRSPPTLQTEPGFMPNLLRFGRYGIMTLPLMLSGDTPLIPSLRADADPVERELNDRASSLLHPFEARYNLQVQRWYNEEIQSYRSHKLAQAEAEAHVLPLPQTETVRVTEREKYRKKCEVGPYSVMRKVCGQYGMQAHHIVPDWTLRYGARHEAHKRIPNMPSLNEGMTICVTGNAATTETEHNLAHLADPEIEILGLNSNPTYTATVDAVKDASIAAMVMIRPACSIQIITAVNNQFAPISPNQLLRTKKYPPLPPATLHALSTGATRSTNSIP